MLVSFRRRAEAYFRITASWRSRIMFDRRPGVGQRRRRPGPVFQLAGVVTPPAPERQPLAQARAASDRSHSDSATLRVQPNAIGSRVEARHTS